MLSADAVLRAFLTPSLDAIRRLAPGAPDGKLPDGELDFWVAIPIRFPEGVEVVVRCDPIAARAGIPMMKVQFGEGPRATTHRLAAEGEVVVPALSSMLHVYYKRARDAPAPPPGPTTEDEASRINAAYGAIPAPARRTTSASVSSRDDQLVLTLNAAVSPRQAEVILAAARLCGLLNGRPRGGKRATKRAAETMGNATATLLGALSLGSRPG